MSLKIQKRILRLAEVIKITGLGRSTIYGLMKDKKFPQNFYLSKRSVGWLESEIYSWLIDRIENNRGSTSHLHATNISARKI